MVVVMDMSGEKHAYERSRMVYASIVSLWKSSFVVGIKGAEGMADLWAFSVIQG